MRKKRYLAKANQGKAAQVFAHNMIADMKANAKKRKKEEERLAAAKKREQARAEAAYQKELEKKQRQKKKEEERRLRAEENARKRFQEFQARAEAECLKRGIVYTNGIGDLIGTQGLRARAKLNEIGTLFFEGREEHLRNIACKEILREKFDLQENDEKFLSCNIQALSNCKLTTKDELMSTPEWREAADEVARLVALRKELSGRIQNCEILEEDFDDLLRAAMASGNDVSKFAQCAAFEEASNRRARVSLAIQLFDQKKILPENHHELILLALETRVEPERFQNDENVTRLCEAKSDYRKDLKKRLQSYTLE